jgi:hypothetical protein
MRKNAYGAVTYCPAYGILNLLRMSGPPERSFL